MSAVVDIIKHIALRDASPDDFARRIRLRARTLGCTVAEASAIGQIASKLDGATDMSRTQIYTHCEKTARQVIAQRGTPGGAA